MTPREEASWRRAYDLFGDLVDLDPVLRSTRLAALDVDPDVRTRLGQLLAAAETTGPLDHLSAADVGLDSADRPATMADRIGDWRLGEILGRGGMGIVFSATRQDVDFEQTAALKLLLEARLDDRAVARFEQERRILALLDHPHIARLIDGGTTVDGTPFLVLEAVDGIPIDEAATTRDATARQIVDWLLDLCKAIAYAHRNLVVHRDLKPANILVDQHGDVRVLDFGVAKLLDVGATSEVETTRVLTPGYGAPEQRVGDAITTAADVYGIGAVAYRLLSGARPSDAPLPAPSTSVHAIGGLDADLDNIVRMATRSEPHDRYPSVDALAEDLRRWRHGLPIRATPDRLPYRLRKFAARHRTAVFASLAVLVSLVVGSGLAMQQATIARQEAERSRLAEADAKRHLAQAVLVSDFLESTFRAADPASSGPSEITAREILDAGSRWIEVSLHEAPEVEAQLRSILARVSFTLGDLDRVEQLLAPSLAAPAPSSATRSAEADRRLTDAVMAARVAAQRGQAELAQERFDEAFRLAPFASADGRLDAELRYCVTLVDLRSGATVVERLEPWLRDGTLADAEPARQAQAHAVLAAAYDQVGRFDEAERVAEAALEGFRAIDQSGGDRLWRSRWLVEQADVRAILANIEANRGALDRALELARASLESRLQLLGPRHPNVLVQRNDVATYLKNLGRFDESAAMLDALLVTQREVLGDAHPYLAYSHFNLGEVLARAADHADDPRATSARALDHYRQAVERLDALPPAHHGPLPTFRAVYGHALGRAGQSARGESELRRALAAFPPDDPPLVAGRLQVLYAEFLNDHGRQHEALDRTSAAVERLAEGYGAGSRHHALALLQHGRALMPTDPDTAQVVLTDAVEALRTGQFHRQYAREIQAGDAALARLAERTP